MDQAPATDEDVARWIGLISAASTFIELKSVGEEIKAHALDKEVRADLLAMWSARKAEVAK